MLIGISSPSWSFLGIVLFQEITLRVRTWPRRLGLADDSGGDEVEEFILVRGDRAHPVAD